MRPIRTIRCAPQPASTRTGDATGGGWMKAVLRSLFMLPVIGAMTIGAATIGAVTICVVVLGAFTARPARAEVSVVDGGIRFTYTGPTATTVAVAGDFNGWNTSANLMTKTGDTFSVVVALTPGAHEYKFVVDGQWLADPENPVTAGEFGNSVVKIGTDGKLIASRATSNTALNPKIYAGGRFLTYYIGRRATDGDKRFDLNRPNFDLDVDLNIRMNDMLDAHMLMNIQSETEDVQFFRSRLNFDRGSLHMHTDQVDLIGFDNDRLGSWEDPLKLVGGIGIYNHDFGYAQQGLQAKKTIGGIDFKLLYSDNFRPGGQGRPSFTPAELSALEAVGSALPVARLSAYRFTDTDNEKDVLAGRASHALSKALTLGVSARLDRGQNPGSAAIFEGVDTTGAAADHHWGSYRTFSGPAIESWWAVGGDGRYSLKDWTLTGEYLHGRNDLDFVAGAAARTVRPGVPVELSTDPKDLPSQKIAVDNRVQLGAVGRYRGLDLGLDFRYHNTAVTPLGNDSALALNNSLRDVTLSAGRELTLFRRKAKARLSVEAVDFTYSAGTPWRNQFWFDRSNFWLEAGEHVVTFDKMVMVGGDNLLSWKPDFSINLLKDDRLNFRYAGTFNGVSLSTRPKYVESLFQLNWKTGASTRIYCDTRWAKYDDPLLELTGGYVSTWLEGVYAFSPTISFSLGFGVDPNVIDTATNEFNYIGRDLFLFGQGANGVTAQENYFSLADVIPRAEKALERERRIQLKAMVTY